MSETIITALFSNHIEQFLSKEAFTNEIYVNWNRKMIGKYALIQEEQLFFLSNTAFPLAIFPAKITKILFANSSSFFLPLLSSLELQ